ncbi:MAG: hypothetical protein ACT4QF_02030 [Sporichthyaceae bacterium]
MPTWHGATYLWSPIAALAVVGVLILVLRWAYSDRKDSLLARRTRVGNDGEYGLLVVVARPTSAASGEDMRRRLAAVGIRGTLTTTTNGLRLMVFPDQLTRAKEVLDPLR